MLYNIIDYVLVWLYKIIDCGYVIYNIIKLFQPLYNTVHH